MPLHRILTAQPEKIYRAFLDPEALMRWLPPNGFAGKLFHLGATVGGTYKMSVTKNLARVVEPEIRG